MKPAIVVTGAASGLGREFARVAASEGMSLVVIDRAREPLEMLAFELRQRGIEAHAVLVDLGSRDAGERLEHALASNNLYCEVLVNNAGLSFVAPAVIGSAKKQLELVDVNVCALTELCLRFLPAMVERGHGGILNVSSVGAYIAGPTMAVYNATKAYVSVLSAALAREVAATGVNVACLVIGKIRTSMWEPTRAKPRAWMERLPESSAREVAEVSWRKFRRGKALIFPQLFYRLATYALRVLPARYYLHLTSGWFGPIPDGEGHPDHLRPAIVVTHAAHTTGRALLAQANHNESDIVLIGRSADGLERLAGELAATGAAVHPLALDLARPGTGDVLEKTLAERNLYCDVLIDGSGLQLEGEVQSLGLEKQMQLLAVNVRALTELLLRFLPGMAARRRGRVLIVSMPAAGAHEAAVCRASKAYAASLSEALSCELSGRGVTIGCAPNLSMSAGDRGLSGTRACGR